MKKLILLLISLLFASCQEVVVLSGKPIEVTAWAYWDCPHTEECRQDIEILLPDGTIRSINTANNSRFAIAKASYMDEISIRRVPNENACPIKSVHITGNNDITLYNLTDEWQTFTVKYDPNLD